MSDTFEFEDDGMAYGEDSMIDTTMIEFDEVVITYRGGEYLVSGWITYGEYLDTIMDVDDCSLQATTTVGNFKCPASDEEIAIRLIPALREDYRFEPDMPDER
jgi:hypothetical protein